MSTNPSVVRTLAADDVSAASQTGAQDLNLARERQPVSVTDGSNASNAAIRAEQPSDRVVIAEVVRGAFGSPVEARLVEAIRASSNFVPDWSLVAELRGQVVAQVMVSYAILRDGAKEHRIANLSPLAVAPTVQGRGIGSALVRAVTARVDEAGEPLVVLEGSPTFYGRLGFEYSVPRSRRPMSFVKSTIDTCRPVFAAMVKFTVPLPVPEAPFVIVIQGAVVTAVQAQPAAAVTAIAVPAPPPATTL